MLNVTVQYAYVYVSVLLCKVFVTVGRCMVSFSCLSGKMMTIWKVHWFRIAGLITYSLQSR